MTKLRAFDEGYLRLVLEIEKHIPGYIDAYFGPAALKEDVAGRPSKEPVVLLQVLAQLREQLPGEDADRAAYLNASLRAIEGTLRILNGEEFDYLEEVSWLYDINPESVDEAIFDAAHRELDTLLPGSGSLAERAQARRKRFELETGKVLPLLKLARAVTRQRTLQFIELVEDEDVEMRLTSDKPWAAYNWYLGDSRSLIEFNTDVPISALKLIGTFAHEGYPGHHTENVLKEQYLYKERGYGEEAAELLHSPAAVIAEAIATSAIEVIFPDADDDHHEWNETVLFPAADLEGESAAQMRRIERARRDLSYVAGNAAILYHTGKLNREQTIDYLRNYLLADQTRAEKSFSFLSNPLYRSYLFTYSWGYDLIEKASRGDKRGLVRRLLLEQIPPSQLARWADEDDRNANR